VSEGSEKGDAKRTYELKISFREPPVEASLGGSEKWFMYWVFMVINKRKRRKDKENNKNGSSKCVKLRNFLQFIKQFIRLIIIF